MLPDGRPIIVMELLQGESLHDFVRRKKRLDVPEAVPILLDICKALGAAHDAGVVHRDLKPENVFLHGTVGQKFVVKVVDFGIAKVLADETSAARRTRTGEVLGTAAYMSPEQVLGKSGIDLRTDVYALGIVVFELLTGIFPFRATSITQWAIAHVRETPRGVRELRPELHKSWDVLLSIALAKEPEARFPNMTAFASAIRAAEKGRRIVRPAWEPRAPQSTAPTRKRLTLIGPGTATGDVGPQGTMKLPDRRQTTPVPADAAPSPHRVAASADAMTAVPNVIPHNMDAETVVPLPHSNADAETVTPRVSRPDPSEPSGGTAAQTVVLDHSVSRSRKPGWPRVAYVGLAVIVVATVGFAILGRRGADKPQLSTRDAAPSVRAPLDAATRNRQAADARATVATTTMADAGIVDGRAPSGSKPKTKPIVRTNRRKNIKTGVVKLRIKPWADVYVDGKSVGQAPTTLNLPVGRHRLLLVNEAANKRERLRIHVRAHKPLVIRRSW